MPPDMVGGMEPFIGQIMLFAGNFAPRGWAFCNGQLLPIAQNQALFSILGTTYGGDGRVTFALPDLQGRSPMHWGNGPGLTPRTLGERSGAETVTLLQNNLPAHTHAFLASSAAGAGDPENRSVAAAKAYGPAVSLTNFAPSSIGATGGSQPHDNMQPYLTINYMIALVGIFPSRG